MQLVQLAPAISHKLYLGLPLPGSVSSALLGNLAALFLPSSALLLPCESASAAVTLLSCSMPGWKPKPLGDGRKRVEHINGKMEHTHVVGRISRLSKRSAGIWT